MPLEVFMTESVTATGNYFATQKVTKKMKLDGARVYATGAGVNYTMDQILVKRKGQILLIKSFTAAATIDLADYSGFTLDPDDELGINVAAYTATGYTVLALAVQ